MRTGSSNVDTDGSKTLADSVTSRTRQNKPGYGGTSLWGLRKEVLLFCLDLVVFMLTPLLALQLRFQGEVLTEHWLPYMAMQPLLLPMRVVLAYLFDLYDFRHRLTASEHAFSALGAAFLMVLLGYFLLMFLQLYYDPSSYLSRMVLPIDFALLVAWLSLSRAGLLRLLHRQGHRVRVALCGAPDACSNLAEEIAQHGPRLVALAGTVHTDTLRQEDFRPAPFDSLRPLQQIILADDSLSEAELNQVLRSCEAAAAEIYLFPALNVSILGSNALMNIAGLPLIPLRASRVYNHYLPIKAVLDRIAALGLLLLSLPIMGVVALLIRLSMGAPVIFAQERVGFQGQHFRLYKFRTMIADAESDTGPTLSPEDDPRITPLGRHLRRYRLDELPQLWNVLRGEMSFVGPRPERPEFVAQFIQETPLYERRHLVMPGLTGLAQLHGRYDSDYRYKLRYDLMYANGQSLLMDLRVLVATLRILFTGSGGR